MRDCFARHNQEAALPFTSVRLPRRLLLQAAAPIAVSAVIAAPADAADAYYPMACDPALVPAVQEAAQLFRLRTGIAVSVLPTPSSLLVPQLTHQIQNDIVMSDSDTVALSDAAGYAVPDAPRPQFRGQLVLAVPVDAPPTALDDAVAHGIVAISDHLPSSRRDDAAILAAMGLKPAKTVGGLDTGAVAFLVATGAAGAGLTLLSDVRANPALKVGREVPAAVASVTYVACTTRKPRRPGPESFVSFLSAGDGADILAHFGVEKIA